MNDTTKETVAIVAFAAGLFALGLYLGYVEGTNQIDCQHKLDKTPELIWNDDFETFPGEGELIRVELDDEDTIYLGPVIK
jgi:hypothetical protein